MTGCEIAEKLRQLNRLQGRASQAGRSPMSRDKILAKLPRMSAACLRANGLTQPPDVDMSHDPHDVTPAKATLRQDRRGPNKTEAAFAAFLEGNGARPIREGVGLRIGNGCVYWPDYVVLSGKSANVYEVKGHMRDDAAVKIKAAASRFPSFKFFLVHRDKSAPSGWKIEEVLP